MTLDHLLYGSKLKRGKTTFNPRRAVVCSRLSDSGEDAKVKKGTQKVGGAGKRKDSVSFRFIFVFRD